MNAVGGPGSPTVLLVDDDDEVRHALRLLFEVEEFRVVAEAANGVDAVTQAMRHEPEFVVLDYLMPHMDGEATARLLRTLVPRTRIVAFSAVLESKPDWADAFLNKSHIAEVAPLLTNLLERGATETPVS